jgi:hypothetical protein
MIHQPSNLPDPKLVIGLTNCDAEAILRFLDRGSPAPTLTLLWRDQAQGHPCG